MNLTEVQVRRFFRVPGLTPAAVESLLDRSRACVSPTIGDIASEVCFNVAVSAPLDGTQLDRLQWLFRETFAPENFSEASFLSSTTTTTADDPPGMVVVVEVGPRLTFSTAWSSNAVSICHAAGIAGVTRIECSRRFRLRVGGTGTGLSPAQVEAFAALVHDRMTECVYAEPLATFALSTEPEPVVTVPVLEEGRAALEQLNAERGFGFDDWDMAYYSDVFVNQLRRNPTDVELFDIAQSNSEHSRHWFFGGKMVLDGEEQERTLFQMVKATLPKDRPSNSIIAFHDNSSSIRGFQVDTLAPSAPGRPTPLVPIAPTLHPILTAETHNFPCGVAPFPGAETGTGGRLRDVQATGRGAHTVAGVSSYCVGNLHIPGYPLPWEERESFKYPPNLATPLDIEVEASNGASDYGNKYGEPVITGFTRSFGMRLPGGERREWVKPIMFSAGVGSMDARHAGKGAPERGMWVVKLGGPAYRIGMGGGAASSKAAGEDGKNAGLDFNAVQRGDAEMENKMNRVIRACVELGDRNPIVSIHDQGAGGNGNVLKEIAEPMGARYEVRDVLVGDDTMSVLEIWGAEYQENNALLCRAEDTDAFKAICQRENCPVALLGQITGDGRVVLHDRRDGSSPVDLPLELVLGKLPQKTFESARVAPVTAPLALPTDASGSVSAALDRVLRLLSVASKRFLVNKVDRSVTGLIAQQQCVGPLQIPLADVGVTALSHLSTRGTAVACGEQPIKGLVSPAAQARLTVGEALTNIMWAQLTARQDIKCSGNWMWAAKLPGEGAAMYDCCQAMCDALLAVGVGVDGGKDSLSMAARVGDETVKAPGELVVTVYCTCEDITKTVTPDFKAAGGEILFVDLGGGRCRAGGSALAQCFSQLGDASQCPDVDDFSVVCKAFDATQELIRAGDIAAGHDRSDGGLITTLLEMAFAGNFGIDVDVAVPPAAAAAAAAGGVDATMALLFNEELGFVIEAASGRADAVVAAYEAQGIHCERIGRVTGQAEQARVNVRVGGVAALDDAAMVDLRDAWEATGFQLERRQRNPACVAQEESGLRRRTAPQWRLGYTPVATADAMLQLPASEKPRVAILRQEGTNGDREMGVAFHAVGFDAWDVTVSDLLDGSVTLESFQGLVFPGGFSYADVLDSGKGWAAVIKFNRSIWQQFQAFRGREDTFSLGVCNGCQLMALLGWIPASGTEPGGILDEAEQPRLVENASGRFESRFSSVTIQPSPAVMFRGMEGSSLGVWVAHGEGRVHFPSEAVKASVIDGQLAPLRYVNDANEVTEDYPFNPNGSPEGIAALCSPDGRHLAMMPHPERCFLNWQWPWQPSEWHGALQSGPWLRLFQNAREFCRR